MSFIYNNEIQYSDSQNLDAFGRLRTSNVTSLLEYKHIHDKLPLVINEATGGTITSIFDTSNSQVVMSVAANNSYVIRQGKSRGIYQPGKGQLAEFSFGNFQLESNVIKRVGYYNTSTSAPYDSVIDGYFLESNGVTNTISFQLWHNGSNVLSATTSSWLTDDYDVSLIDWSKTQLMHTDFQWLGVGRLRFALVIDGVPKTFVTNSGTNNLTTVYMKAPNQPIRYEIRQSGAGTGGTFNMICSQVSLEGTINSIQKSTSISAFAIQSKPTQNVKYPIVGYRVNSGYGGVNITLSDVQILNVTNPSKADYFITIELNPTLSSSYSFTNISNTPVDYALSTGQTITASGHIVATFLGSGSGVQVDSFQFQDNILRPGVNINGTRDEVWLCVVGSGNNQDYRSSLNLSYFD